MKVGGAAVGLIALSLIGCTAGAGDTAVSNPTASVRRDVGNGTKSFPAGIISTTTTDQAPPASGAARLSR